ncbi:ABC transporter [candidate division TA06 bacterium DG_24]|uniref:Transport permease protein n=3 Tax=Bacteria division TA06 TaxID=1156500 RepID=A0A0S8JJF5_UNCT6|nr:MAG: ABC transporter [candidate division TA06 bacterium DG_24]KPK70229.1 MAG: ABC transporter [candidate division TA06 bacterium SM23_40]KPL09664.1 MAG: ABC transporter [candidate division TA06 bacterium SM1_40]
MSTAESGSALLSQQARGAVTVAKKNALIYYFKPPVLIFGVLFPVFFFLAFSLGRSMPADRIVPAMVAMALWFTASAVGPLVTPWERTSRTYERLISTPIAIQAIVAGDVLSGFAFGISFSLVPLLLGLAFTDTAVASATSLVCGIVLGALAFSSLGVLLAAPPVHGPSYIMMLSNLVRLPLLFVSGIFVPIAEMPAWARWLAPISPLSYCADCIRRGFGETGYFPFWLNPLMLVLFSALFSWAACRFHIRSRAHGL